MVQFLAALALTFFDHKQLKAAKYVTKASNDAGITAWSLHWHSLPLISQTSINSYVWLMDTGAANPLMWHLLGWEVWMGNSQLLPKMDETYWFVEAICSQQRFNICLVFHATSTFLSTGFPWMLFTVTRVRGQGVCNTTAEQMRAEFDAQQKEVSVVRIKMLRF